MKRGNAMLNLAFDMWKTFATNLTGLFQPMIAVWSACAIARILYAIVGGVKND